jgi:hypothetical protein
MPTPIPMPVQSLFAPGWASAADAAVVEMVSTVVDVLVVDSSVLLSVVVTTGLAFVVIGERVDDELDGDELGELDDDEADADVEEVDEGPGLGIFEEADVEVVDSVVEDEEVASELVEEVAAADTVIAAPKFQLLARNNEPLLLQHCAPSSIQQ